MKLTGITIMNGSRDGIHADTDDIERILTVLLTDSSRNGRTSPSYELIMDIRRIQMACIAGTPDAWNDAIMNAGKLGLFISPCWLMESSDMP